MTLFLLIAKTYWKQLTILLALLGGLAWTYHEGGARVQVKWDAAKKAQAAEITALKGKSDKVTVQVVTQYVDRVQVVQAQAKTIIKKVPIYVTKVDDSRCTINNGFVSVWNAANSGVQLPDAASATDGQASGILLSDVATQHASEAEYARLADEKIDALQNWISQQAAVKTTAPKD